MAPAQPPAEPGPAPAWHAWLRLVLTPGVGPVASRKLLEALGSPEAIFHAGGAAWRAIVSTTQAEALALWPTELPQQLERTAQWLASAPERHHLLCLDDPLYPPQLRALPDAPPLIFALGDLGWLERPSVAVIGSRQCTPQGREHARHFAQGLSQAGVTVISGLAIGIDGEAHEGALQGPGSTIAVVGTGLDIVYPRRHRALAHRIAEHGLLLSEFCLGTPSHATHFPRRNRLIAGLALGTLVVEAGLPSGSLITAQLAADQGREVFAIPGPIHAPQARGCHHLIKQGAKLVETVEDVLQELPGTHLVTPCPPLAQPAEALLNASAPVPGTDAPDSPTASPRPTQVPTTRPSAHALSPDLAPWAGLLEALDHGQSLSLDQLCERCGWPIPELQTGLLALELSGWVTRLPGGRFARIGYA